MRLPPIKEAYLKIERPLIYVLILTLIIIQTATSVLPTIADYVPSTLTIPAVLTVLLLGFRYVDDGLRSVSNDIRSLDRTDKIETKDRFSEAIDQLFADNETVEQVDFLGSSSGSFLPSIKARNIKVNQGRIMIRNPESEFQIPEEEEKEKSLETRIDDKLRDWKAMCNDGNLEEVCIKGFNFEPVIFGIVVDGEKGAFGWFEPSDSHPYFHVMNTHVIHSDDEEMDPILRDFSNWFDLMYNEYSEVIWDSQTEDE